MKKLLYAVYLVLATAVLLEAGLQLVAFVIYRTHAGEAAPGAASTVSRSGDASDDRGDGVVLCVGDAFTFGIGATTPSRSYPQMVRDRLRSAHGLEVAAVNAGWPGYSSYDVLRELAGLLRRTRPRVVCVLVGENDAWLRPARLTTFHADRGARGFVFRWRTARLIRWLSHGAPARASAADSAAQDRSDSAAPPTPAMLTAADSLLRGVGLEPADVAGRSPEPRAAAVRAAMPRVQQAIDAGDDDAVVATAEPLLRAHPDEAVLYPPLVAAHLRSGRRARALELVDRLRALHAREPSRDTAGCMLRATGAVGRTGELYELSKQFAAEYPDLLDAWEVLGASSPRDAAHRWEGVVAMTRFVQLLGDRRPAERARVLRRIARAIATDDPPRSVRLLVASALITGDRHDVAGALRASRRLLRPGELGELVRVEGLDERGRRLLDALRAEVRTDGSAGAWLDVLEWHLVKTVETCRAHGAEPVLLTYPRARFARSTAIGGVQREVAKTHGVELVDARALFDRLLSSDRARDELLGDDGTCSDAGYAELGALVAARVARHLRR